MRCMPTKQQNKKLHTAAYPLLLTLWLLIVAAPCRAQQENAGDKVYKAEEFGFNALEVNQGRFFIGDKVPYEKGKGILEHFSVGLGARFDRIKPQYLQSFRWSEGVNLYAEKELDRLNSLQVALTWGVYEKNRSKYLLHKSQLELAHYFDWTRFFVGYNPYRPYSFATSLRAGLFTANYHSQINNGRFAALGARATLMLTPSFYFNAEPYLAIASDNIDFSGNDNFHHYDVTYGITASISYMIKGNKYVPAYDNSGQRIFFDYSMGAIFGLNTQLPIFQTIGPSMGVGLGYWADNRFGLRFKGNFSVNRWKEMLPMEESGNKYIPYVHQFGNFISNAQLEMMVNMNSYFTALEELPIGINLLAGWQLGWLTKHDGVPEDLTQLTTENGKLLSCNHDGPTIGMQFHWQHNAETALYLEPRLTFSNYRIPYLPPHDDIVELYGDYYFSLNLGVETSFIPQANRSKISSTSVNDDRNWAIGVGFGPGTSIYQKVYGGKSAMEYLVGLHLAYGFNACHGLRMGADVTQTSDIRMHSYTNIVNETPYDFEGLWSCKYQHLNVFTEYQCDLTSLFNGYNPDCRLGMQVGVGPVLSTLLSEKGNIDPIEGVGVSNEYTPTLNPNRQIPLMLLGAQMSAILEWDITSRYKIFVEERARLYSNSFIAEPHAGNFMRLLYTQIGLTYTL